MEPGRGQDQQELTQYQQHQSSERYKNQRKSSLDNLMMVSSKLKKYHCPKCDKSFSQSYSMYRHYRYECDSLPRYQCPYCGHVSKWSHSIYNHIRKLHPGQEVILNKLY